MKHLLVTNDFPPKIGGIQNLLYEWWRRLPPESFAVLTSPYAGSQDFDRAQNFLIRRTRESVLLPHPLMVRRINKMAQEFGAWYIANRDPKWLRRNALVILGNIGDANDKLVVELLQKYCNHSDAILRSHAVWAAARLGLNHLLPVSEDDEIVLAELRALPSVK